MLHSVIGLMGTSYDADAVAYFAQLSPQPSTAFKNAVNTFILQLKADSNWAHFHRLRLHATEQQAHARVSIVNPTSTQLTEVNSPAWTSGQGYTGNGTNMYLDSNFDFAGVDKDNVCFGGYCTITTTSTGILMGVAAGGSQSHVRPYFGGTNVQYSVTDTAGDTVSGGTGDSKGLFVVGRTSSSTQKKYWINGALINTTAKASQVITSADMFILARNNAGVADAFYNNRVALSFTATGSINQAAFYSAVQALATTLGFNV